MSDTEARLDEFDKWYNDHREITGSLTRTYIACRAAWRAASESTPAESTLERIKSYIAGEQGSHHRQRGRDEILHDIWEMAAAHSHRESLTTPKHRWTGSEGADAELLEKAYDYGGFEKAVLDCNLAGPEAFATDENGRYRYDQMRSLAQLWMTASHPQRKQDVIPGIAGQSPCAGCGKGMDGAFYSVSRVGGKWYHQNCISQRKQAPAPEQPKCDCGAGDNAYLACHADVCSLRKWANPASEARSHD